MCFSIEKQIYKTSSFTVACKSIKYLGINLRGEKKDNSFLKEIKKDTLSEKISCVCKTIECKTSLINMIIPPKVTNTTAITISIVVVCVCLFLKKR